MRRTERGMTLIEVAVALAIFGVFLLILISVQAEMFHFERTIRLRTHSHPELQSLVSRVRRDVLDSVSYPVTFAGYTQSGNTLIVSQVEPDGTVQTIVYDLSRAKEATRLLYRGSVLTETWKAGGLPALQIGSYEMPAGVMAVRLRARNELGEIIIDRFFQPRIHS